AAVREEMATREEMAVGFAAVREEMATREEMAVGFAAVREEMAHYHDEAMREAHARDQAWAARLRHEASQLGAQLRHELATQLEYERVAWQKQLDRLREDV
ncbi:MAG: hypothetical protein KC503_22805, partial [Myxococcales bacterium]|nr:hypothetical protein [Myxococcales bacterium]